MQCVIRRLLTLYLCLKTLTYILIVCFKLLLKRIVNFTIRIVGIVLKQPNIQLIFSPKPLIKNDKKPLTKQLIIKEITNNQLKINKII